MSWKAEHRKIYEERVLNDALARLAGRLDVAGLPLSREELKTLAKRSRESFNNPAKGIDRLERYKAHLANSYGADVIEKVSANLQEIQGEIGYEEK
jgi:hypothetical protein